MANKLTPEQIQEQQLAAYEAELQQAMANQSSQGLPYSAAMYANQSKQNLVEQQLDFRDILENIERALRNDVLVRDKNGNEAWIRNPDPTKILLNDLGVSDVLKKIISLINKNKVLSNFSEEQVSERVKLISHDVRMLIYKNYPYYGIDNEYKENCYSSLVIDLNDMIEAAYRRSLNGEERRDLNQARIVQQNDPIQPQSFNFYGQNGAGGSKKKWYNPFSWAA